jgi:hypothetical protein
MTSRRKQTEKAQKHENGGQTSASGRTVPQILLDALLKIPSIIRWPILIIVALCSLVYVIWTSLPTSTQENLIGVLRHHHSAISSSQSVIDRETDNSQKPPSTTSTDRTKVANAANISILLAELHQKELYKDLEAAESFLGAQTENSVITALERYDKVVHNLSPGACAQLDHALLDAARSDEEGKHLDDAAAKYRALFSNVLAQYRRYIK